MSLYEMTKGELILNCRRLQSENVRLQDELDTLSDCYTELENQLADRINAEDDDIVIKDVWVFKRRLEIEGLLTPQMKSFIENYLKYYNETRG